MVKFFQYTLILVALGVVTYSIYDLARPICSKTLNYRIGAFDSAFGITNDKFKILASQAEAVWENELKKNIFNYDTEANFKINLIYDEKQLATMQKQKTESGLTALESEFESLDRSLTNFKYSYESRVESYENSLNSFNKKKSAYDEKISYWNSEGGAPRSVYVLLEEERINLNSEASRLNSEAESLNKMADELNDIVIIRNAKAEEYNRVAREYNRKYGEGLEFNQAEYTGKEINVYQFGSEKELLLALVHEFGHALGMGHVENPDSVMHYLSTGGSNSAIKLSQEDVAELNRVCKNKNFIFW